MHPYVVGELLLGGLSDENEALMHSLDWCEPAAADELHDFIHRFRLAGSGMGWVDAALLFAAQASGSWLATYDTTLARCARQLDIGTSLPLPAQE